MAQNEIPPTVLDMLVRMPSGAKIPVQVDTSVTVEELKTLVYAVTDIPEDEQKLVYGGQILVNEKIVTHYGFKTDGIIFLVRSQTQQPPVAQVKEKSDGNIPNDSLQDMAGPNSFMRLLQGPLMSTLTQNPEIMKQMVMSDPRIQRIVENNPEINQVFSDPRFMRQIMEMSSNPNALKELQRNQDRALANMEMLPGGFNALQRMYQTLAPLEQQSDNNLEREEENNRRIAQRLNVQPVQQQILNSEPLPNPWSPAPTRPQTAERYPNQLQSLVDMGFERSRAVQALEVTSGNLDEAVDYLVQTLNLQ